MWRRRREEEEEVEEWETRRRWRSGRRDATSIHLHIQPSTARGKVVTKKEIIYQFECARVEDDARSEQIKNHHFS